MSQSIDFDVNGQPRSGTEGMTVRQLIADLGLGDRRVAVELNLSVVIKAEYDQTVIHDGDRLEIVSLVGGG